ncbi:hypothetical protein Poly51_30690 [Rubripirellula tenax]|uniref:SGNH hydrolase-type esterase domain-containing protein n=1 Tax=Rubripirellula tenax TaxID=2528015 RepID=A0A5C6EZ55_9BACT|nr:SGNH/GDSL hydrolase family protein [Rubripirellula tenax]TWU54352.1 hypothetical protein Poly51_30690 [Rubripirellula tenax]
MNQILVYADSLSWGIIPGTRNRLPFHERWPGVMEGELLRKEWSVRVIEDCLNGRRTVWEDPLKPGRNGLVGIEQRIEVNSPLSLVILFLGANDFQSVHRTTARQSAQGVAALVAAIRRAPIECGMPMPEIMLVAPPPIKQAKGDIASKFEAAELKSVGLADAISDVANHLDCDFLDAGVVVTTSNVDGVHLDVDQHRLLGVAIAARVVSILERSE